MARNMTRAGASAGRQQVAEQDDMDNVALDSSTFKAVWTQTGKSSEVYWAGYGIEHQNSNVGRAYLDARTLDDDADGTPDKIAGKARIVVYEDESRDYYKAVGPVFSLGDLRDAVSDARTDRPMLAALNPGAGEDEVVGLEIKAASANDGDTFEPGNSDAHIPFTAVRV